MDNPNTTTEEKIKKSLRYSIIEGAGWSCMLGFGEAFFSVFAVFLGASNFQLSILASLPSCIGSLSQSLSYKLLNLIRSRKKFVVTSVIFQALMFIPICFVFFIDTRRVDVLILFAVLYMLFGMVSIPAWNSWMGDLVNINEKGRYFGKRSKITGLGSFLSFIAAGFLLQKIGDITGNRYLGFITIFTIAFASRIFSFSFLIKKYEPEYRIDAEERPSIMDFIKDPKLRNFTRLSLYVSLMSFSIFVSAPFFTPYMLKDLKLDYKFYTIVIASSSVVRFFTLSIWGRLCDIYGTRKVLAVSGFLMPIIPFLWLFDNSIPYLVLIQAYNGFIWAGFEISSFNYIYDTTRPTNRVTSVAYFNILNGIAILFGALIGNLLVKHGGLFWSTYMIVFLISGVLRYAVSFIFLPRLKEERKVRDITYGKLLLHAFSSIPATDYMFRAYTVVRNSRLVEDSFLKKKK